MSRNSKLVVALLLIIVVMLFIVGYLIPRYESGNITNITTASASQSGSSYSEEIESVAVTLDNGHRIICTKIPRSTTTKSVRGCDRATLKKQFGRYYLVEAYSTSSN